MGPQNRLSAASQSPKITNQPVRKTAKRPQPYHAPEQYTKSPDPQNRQAARVPGKSLGVIAKGRLRDSRASVNN